MKREQLDWLASNPRFTRRYVLAVGRRCRSATLTDVAADMDLHWETVKAIDIEYMTEQLALAGPPAPRVIGIDELSIGPRHAYRIVVSDLERKRPIWFGGTDRSEASMDGFYQWLGPEKSREIRLAVMDMWKPFRSSTQKPGHASQAGIVFDKFHVIRHLSHALDQVRKLEYARLRGNGRQFIKGQKFNLLTRWENLTERGRDALEFLFKANQRLYRAYLLKERFGQLWDFTTPEEAWQFFIEWNDSLRWQKLEPYRRFARMIIRHWDGIASYCDPANKVSLGFIEGLNNKIRTLQKRAYGFRDEEYLRLKILTCTLNKI